MHKLGKDTGMRGFARTMSLGAVVAAAICAGSATQASAYTYTIASGTPLKKVWLHTVSAFCHDRSWQGNWSKEGNPLKMSTASICLVDRVEITDILGKTAKWSGAGVPGQVIWFKYDWNGNPYIDMYTQGWLR
jgi:hypothetical protein